VPGRGRFTATPQAGATYTLVGLAAGAGSRFGGPKQLEPLGPGGETMLDFAIHDALRAGFNAVVLIVRREMREAFERGVVARWSDRVPVSLAFQDVPRDRKPWGTVDAVLAAAPQLASAFAVVNADDYYGSQAYAELYGFLHGASLDTAEFAVVGFPLAETLSQSGGVTRALLRASPDGWLEHIEEMFEIRRGGDGAIVRADNGATRAIPGDVLVSMNMWGFTPAVFQQFERGVGAFREAHRDDPRAELPIPTLVQSLVCERQARVRLLPGAGPWCGVTYPADREPVTSFLGTLVERGEYPTPAWG
jgi:hypothetical protein